MITKIEFDYEKNLVSVHYVLRTIKYYNPEEKPVESVYCSDFEYQNIIRLIDMHIFLKEILNTDKLYSMLGITNIIDDLKARIFYSKIIEKILDK